MTRRIVLLALALNLAVVATHGWAQQTNKIPVVGYLALATGPDDPITVAWRQGLRELGYVDGQNIRLEFRTAQGHPDRLPGLAEELAKLNVNVLFVGSYQAAQALRRTTSTIPIVVALLDPLAAGLVTNLAHPGGNITGLSSMTADLWAKRLQLLKETIPGLTRVAVLWAPSTPPTPLEAKAVDDIKAAARSLSIELKFVVAKTPEEFSAAFSAIRRAHVQAIYLIESPLFYLHGMTLAKLALESRLPTIYATRALPR